MPEGKEPDTSALPGPREIRRLDRLAGLLGLVDAVEQAVRDVLTYWQPLLPACQRGETPVPRQPLRTEQARADAMVEALDALPSNPIRDEALERMQKAATAVARWLPEERGSHLTSQAYEGAPRSTPGSPLPKGPDRRDDADPMRAAVGRRLKRMALAIAVLSVFAAANLLLPSLLKRKPHPVEQEEYQELVPAVVKKELSGSTLVLTMREFWARQDIGTQTDDIFRLMMVGGPEPYTQMVLRDEQGRNLAWVTLKGQIEWTGPLRGHSNAGK
jgi:hypothetical protein